MTRIMKSALIAAALMSISGCANTIQGFGADSANAVSATQKATQAVGATAINAVQ